MAHQQSSTFTLEQIQQNLEQLLTKLRAELKEASAEKLETLRIETLGKKGRLTEVLKNLSLLELTQRAEAGALANKVKAQVEEELEIRAAQIKQQYYTTIIEQEYFDVTALTKPYVFGEPAGSSLGNIHPISITQKKLEDIFTSMGFSIMDGPQVETDYNNFGALNFTDDHPARDMQDTFYTSTGNLLRTHTSAVQVRAMHKLKPPMRMIVPGRVFRYEEIDASHEHTFYQMEGMIIDRQVSISHLLFLMQTLLKEIFSSEVKVRLRPGYFPFVEPGFELDMQCLICNGPGCSVCKHSGWVEVLPCGLVHPNVIKAGGLDPNEWQGAAFGLGLNRLVMMQHAIEDIRYFQNPNPEFLKQFLETVS